jgi:hypothetical protein
MRLIDLLMFRITVLVDHYQDMASYLIIHTYIPWIQTQTLIRPRPTVGSTNGTVDLQLPYVFEMDSRYADIRYRNCAVKVSTN